MIFRFLTILMTLLMLVGSPAIARSNCAAMKMDSTVSAHACCGGESACCKAPISQNLTGLSNCSCSESPQSSVVSSASLKFAFEQLLKAVVIVAAIFFAYLAVKVSIVATSSDRWRPPKIDLYIFYRSIKI